MTLEQAREINRLCCGHSLWLLGVSLRPESLADYTLSQLVEARDLVRAQGETVDEQGRRSMALTCDDRLLAALYVAYHYPARAELIAVSAEGVGVLNVDASEYLAIEVVDGENETESDWTESPLEYLERTAV